MTLIRNVLFTKLLLLVVASYSNCPYPLRNPSGQVEGIYSLTSQINCKSPAF